MTAQKPKSFYMVEMESTIEPGEHFYIHAHDIGDGLEAASSGFPNSKVVAVWLQKPILMPESEWKNGSGNS